MSGFHHEAVFYAGDEEYVAAAVPEIHAALAGEGSVLVAVGDAKRHLLRDALGEEDGERVRFAEMEALGRNPACIIPAWRDFLRAAGPEPVLGIGEPVWPGRSSAELVECSRHESLLNLAFDDGRGWRLLCPYDTTVLAPDVLDEARRNHPHVRSSGRTRASGDYAGRPAILAWDDRLPAPAVTPAALAFSERDLALVRDFATGRARAAGLSGNRLDDVVLAVNELASNSLRHGGGRGILRAWEQDGMFICEVRDAGRIADPLAGRDCPPDEHGGGRGLWIVNQLCDLVQVRSSRAGTVVRLHVSPV